MKTEGPEMLSRTHTSIHKTNTDLFKKFVLLIKINIETYKNNVEFFCIKIINKKKKIWAIFNTCACLHLLHITNKSTTRPQSSVASKNFEKFNISLI